MAQITLNSTGVASSGALALQSNGTTTAVTIDASQNVGIGTASPARLLSLSAASPILRMTETGANSDLDFIVSTNSGGLNISVDANNEGANSFCAVSVDGSERMRINSSGNVGIGTSSPSAKLHVSGSEPIIRVADTGTGVAQVNVTNNTANATFGVDTSVGAITGTGNAAYIYNSAATPLCFFTNATERARIDSSGDLLVGKTSGGDISVNGIALRNDAFVTITTSGGTSLYINRNTNDGELVQFRQANTAEGSISVSGTTVTYGGGHLARFGQLPDGSEDPTLLKGTVLTNLDEMCVWINKETGIPADNEQCNKVKISDVDGDANVAGVFVSWSYDEQHETNDLFVAMTGDMIIRIAQGVTVARGDLLMSAGDGTAKPQGDDIIRSKTVAKVTSTHVTCTYADGSYCVPCVLMAC
jgi:hypothetical protein